MRRNGPVVIEFHPSSPDFIEVERVEGNLLYLKGHPYPHKGIPTIPTLEIVNRLKRRILFLNRKDRDLAHSLTLPFNTFSDELCRLLTPLTGENAHTIATIFEYDQAYRFRLQDLLTESSKENLTRTPISEILRLLGINRQRDYPQVHRKFLLFALFLVVYLLWPWNRQKFKEAIQNSDFARLQFDEGDLYWALQKIDYNYGG